MQSSKVKRNAMAVFPGTKDSCREANKLLHAHGKQYEMHLSCCPYAVEVINSSHKYFRLEGRKKNLNVSTTKFQYGLPREADAFPALRSCRFDTRQG